MAYYKDLREYFKALEVNNKLVRIKREINKDTELALKGEYYQTGGKPAQQRVKP